MNGFLTRIFAPTLAARNAELTQSNAERDWWRKQCEDAGEVIRQERLSLRTEIARNRKREDALTNQIIQLAGGRGLPAREIETEQPPEEAQQPNLLNEAKLRERAQEYVDQRATEAMTPNAREEMIAEVFEKMKENPEHWLAD